MRLVLTFQEIESVTYNFLRKKIKLKNGSEFNSIEGEFDTEKWFLGTISFSIYIKQVLPKEIRFDYKLGNYLGRLLKLGYWFGVIELDPRIIKLDIYNKEITIYPFKLDNMRKFGYIFGIKNLDFKEGEVNLELSEIQSILS